MPTAIPSVVTFSSPEVAAPFDAVKNPTAAVQYWMRRDIIRGVFAPGERLKVDPLMAMYGVGRTPMREAIVVLAGGGLVEHVHQKGYRVSETSLDDYLDVVDVYYRLYRLAIADAVKHGRQDWEEGVILALHRLRHAHKELPGGDPENREIWQRAYLGLQFAILDGCASPLLRTLIDGVGDRLERYVTLYGDLSSDLDRDHKAEHQAIVDALIDRNAGLLLRRVGDVLVSSAPIHESVVQTLAARQGVTDRTKGMRAVLSGRSASKKKA